MEADELLGVERDAGAENVSDSNIFFYVMLTLVFLLSVLAITIAIIAYVKATGQLIGPQGPAGPDGSIPVAQLFEQPPFYVSALDYVISNDPNVAPRFLVFTSAPPDPKTPITVRMPNPAVYSGKIFRFYNIQAPGGLLLLPPDVGTVSIPGPAAFNPILQGYLAFVISDGSTWIINSSSLEITMGTGP